MNSKYRHNVLSVGVAAACALMGMAASTQARAQDAKEEVATTKSKEAKELDTVLVTVERREQNLQKYAGTAQALSPEDLRGLGINNELRNIQVAIPGLSIANQEGNVEIYMRGVGSANNTELGDPANAPHINGVYIPRPRGLGGMFYDLERVEVNKGPQGTLRGRNALGGSLNIVTKRPEIGVEEFNGYAQGEWGNRNQFGGEFGADVPIGEKMGLRISGYKIKKDSSFKNVGLSPKLAPAGEQDEDGLRLSFSYEPNDKLSIFAMADIGNEGGTGYPGANLYTTSRAGFGVEDDGVNLRNIIYRGPQGKLDSTNYGFMTDIVYDFGSLSLEYSGSFRKVDFQQTNASNEGLLYPGRDLNSIDFDSFSSVYWYQTSESQVHELRLFSNDDARFRWTAGLFHFDEDQQSGFFSLADKGIFYSGTEFTMPIVQGKSSAIFADGTFDINDKFRVKGGLRYTDEQKYRYGIGGNWVIGLGSDGFNCCFSVRLGTEGFQPAFINRPNFDVSGLGGNNAATALFLLQGFLTPGARDTLIAQLGGVVDGTRPNGTCIDRPDINGATQNCPANGQHSFFALGAPTQQVGRSKNNFLDWRLGFEYDISDSNLLYATASSGHKAGGFNDSFDPNVIPETYDPESIIALEIGSKNSFQLFDRTSTLNVSGFYYNYSDQVFQDLTVIGTNPVTGAPSGYALVNRNIGKSRLYGVELESALRFNHGFSLNLNALYLNTRIKEGVLADARSQNFGQGGVTSRIDLAGNELPLSSKLTFNARLQQAIELRTGTFDWQILGSYRSSFYLSQFNDREVTFVDVLGVVQRVEDAFTAGFPGRQKGATTLNAGVGFTSLDGAIRLEAWGSNLLNNDVSQKALVGSGLDLRFLNDARSYGVRLRYNF
jgi:iron complex outermembrane recepter protein